MGVYSNQIKSACARIYSESIAPVLTPEQRRFDADGVLFSRQVEHVYAQTYDEKFPGLKMANGEIIPLDTSVPTGAMTYTYYTLSQTGVAAIMNAYSQASMPRVDLLGRPTTGNIVPIGAAYGYNIQDLRAAAMAGVPLDAMKAKAARRAHDQRWNSLGWFGSPSDGVYGLLTSPNITVSRAPLNAGSTSRTWASKTPAEIHLDVQTLINTVKNLTKECHTVSKVVLAAEVYTDINSRTWNSANSANLTVLGYLKTAFEGVEFISAVTLNANDHPGTEFAGLGLAVALCSDSAELVVPQIFEQFPPQWDGLEMVIPTHSRCGGVKIPYPLSVHVMHGI